MKPNPVEDRYAELVGAEALARQKAERAAGRCDGCWAPPGEPHSPLCPEYLEQQESEPPSQSEGLF